MRRWEHEELLAKQREAEAAREREHQEMLQQYQAAELQWVQAHQQLLKKMADQDRQLADSRHDFDELCQKAQYQGKVLLLGNKIQKEGEQFPSPIKTSTPGDPSQKCPDLTSRFQDQGARMFPSSVSGGIGDGQRWSTEATAGTLEECLPELISLQQSKGSAGAQGNSPPAPGGRM